MKINFVRQAAVLLLGTCIGLPFAKSQEKAELKSERAVEQEVLKTDDAFNQAVLTSDESALDKILADKLSWVARGDRLNKEQVIADLKSKNLHFKSLTHDELVLKMFGNIVVVTGHSTSVLEYKGKLMSTPRLFTTVYMKLDGRWQMIAHQVSNVDEK